jgi:hypothetical protein
VPILRLAALLGLVLAACTPAEPPPGLHVLHLRGTAYERGLQHGKALSSQVKSFYTTMLATSLLPYLNREHATIAGALKVYAGPEYQNGQFSVKLLRDSAKSLESFMPADFRDELRGIADGSGLPYDDVLVLNTFVDTTLAARAVTYFLHQAQAPRLESISFTKAGTLHQGLQADGIDNDGDGKTDEANEAKIDFAASATASFIEAPADSALMLRLVEDDGVDPKTVRVLVGSEAFPFGHTALQVAPVPLSLGASATDWDVTWTPPQPLKGIVTVQVQAADNKLVTEPKPAHPRAMRTQQFTFTVAGTGKPRWQVENRGLANGISQPPAISFGLRGSATKDGKPLLAHHFSLLDAGTSHKHCLLQMHEPKDGAAYAFVGWAGVAYGMSGINADGVALSVNISDSLNNPLVGQFKDKLFDAQLLSRGVPAGVVVRRVLAEARNTNEAVKLATGVEHTFGWNLLVIDAASDLRAVEAHGNVMQDHDSAPVSYAPAQGSGPGRNGWPRNSVGPDDLRMGVHFLHHAEDLWLGIGYEIRPQRHWSTYFFASVRAQGALGDAIAKDYGAFDVSTVQAVLRQPLLVDRNDSMNAVVFEPVLRRFHVAAGTVPATDTAFQTFALPGWK